MILFLIALGGAVGSALRYLIGGAVQRLSASGYPVGTMVVNVATCYLALVALPPGHVVAGLGAAFGLGNVAGSVLAWLVLSGLSRFRVQRALDTIRRKAMLERHLLTRVNDDLLTDGMRKSEIHQHSLIV